MIFFKSNNYIIDLKKTPNTIQLGVSFIKSNNYIINLWKRTPNSIQLGVSFFKSNNYIIDIKKDSKLNSAWCLFFKSNNYIIDIKKGLQTQFSLVSLFKIKQLCYWPIFKFHRLEMTIWFELFWLHYFFLNSDHQGFDSNLQWD